jgi:small subunit ribosomal protein S16
MPVRIRLRRVGRKKQPSYRIVVAEGQTPRSGAYVDNLGYYNPRTDPIELKIDLEKVDQWLARGAEVTPTVKSLIRKARQGATEAVAAKPAQAKPAAKAPVEETPVVEAAAAEATVAAAEAEAPAETGEGEATEAPQE